MAKNTTRMTTPPCEVRWAHITRPNYTYASAQDPRGTYQVLCVLDPEQPRHKAFLEELQAEWDRGYEVVLHREGKKKVQTHGFPWSAVEDEEGEDTGLVGVRPKNKESFTNRDGEVVKIEIPVFDAQKQRVNVEPGNGSLCRVSFDVNPFYTAGKYGLQFRLKAVQVLSLVEYDAFGFDAEESGYVGTPYTPPVESIALAPSQAPPAAPVASDGFAAAADSDELPF